MSDYVHIVSLDAPSPPDYGGAIDIYYKIVALARIGKKVILHYFDYKGERGIQGLEEYCYKVYSYKRLTGFRSISLRLPYIVRSRMNKDLIKRLNQDEHPVILEGIHCTGVLKNIKGINRKIVVRLHNNEYKYYKSLAGIEQNPIKRLYFLFESFLLGGYQRKLPKEICIAGLSISDLEDFYSKQFTNVHFLPTFIPWQEVKSRPGTGSYCLYHGNLSISENEEAACWLIDNIFSKTSIPLIIAGKGSSKRIIKKASIYNNIQVVLNPEEKSLEMLLYEAQLNILPSFNNTGVKLKLLNAILNGRYCITNYAGINGSMIKKGVIIIESKEEMMEKIIHFFFKSFSESEKRDREQLLELYNNHNNALKLSALLW